MRIVRRPVEEILAKANMGKTAGVRCQHCGCRDLRVQTTEPLPNGCIRRYRVCRACGHHVTTVERPKDSY
jgi:DNA-directed RNA polymerase subunit RPC12/RpoP